MRNALALIFCLLTTAIARSQERFQESSQQPAESTLRDQPQHRAELGVQALQRWYLPSAGLYRSTGWWNSANALTALIDYMRASGSRQYIAVLANTFTQAQITVPKTQQIASPLPVGTPRPPAMTGFPGFLNHFYDDEGWWALAWIDAYDLTHDRRYLATAQSIFDDMARSWDDTCGGGIWWSKDRTYKNAIANELFFSVAAHLATRAPADPPRYADWATKEWRWFRNSGMINDHHLVNDGLTIDKVTGACRNNGRTVWTYNQGVVLGALAEWSKSPGNSVALRDATEIADAALRALTDADGVLHETCEPRCGADGIQFKGIFLRNLRELNMVARDDRYRSVFARNAESIWTKDQAPGNQFGVVWSGPPLSPNAGTQSSALDALVAALSAANEQKK